MLFEPRDYLRHILDETRFLLEQSRKYDLESFRKDELVRRAFVRSIEIIGEATKQLPAEFREEHPEVEWRVMARMRDRVIHGYFSINDQLVWEVVADRIPKLHDQLTEILRQVER